MNALQGRSQAGQNTTSQMTGSVVLQFSTTVNSIANWYSILIRRICHSPFSHVDLVLPDGGLLGASDSPNTPVLEGNPRGVAVRPPDYEEFGLRCQAIIETPAADAVIAAARSQLGKPFDGGALDAFLSAFDVGAVDNWRDPEFLVLFRACGVVT